jgi:predicted dehydrogenase
MSAAPRVAFVGAGMVAELHARAIGVGGHLQLAGVFDVDCRQGTATCRRVVLSGLRLL